MGLRTTLFLASFLAAFAAALYAATLAVNIVEQRSLIDVETALVDAEHTWAGVTVDGLQVTITGTAPDEATRFAALSAAGTVVDASRLIDGMEVAAALEIEPPRFSVEILRNTDGISVVGLFPEAEDRDRLISGIESIAGGTVVTDLMETSGFPTPDGWSEAVAFGVGALDMLPQSKVSIAPNEVTIAAMATDDRTRRSIEAKLRSQAPDGLKLVLDISAPRPVITPYTLRLVSDGDGTRFDACTAETEEALERIIAAAVEIGAEASADCRLGIGSPSPDWVQAVTAGIATVGRLDGGTLTFSDTEVSLIAPVSTPVETFETEVGALEAALPGGFSLTAVLPEPEGEASDEGPPQFTATRTEKGVIELRGRVLDDRAKMALVSFAEARFGRDNVSDGTLLHDDLPTGWSPRVLAALDALTLVKTGTATVEPDGVRVRGVSGLTEARAEIARRLSATLGEGANYTIDVTYDRRFDPTLNLPTAETCVERINTALKERKVTFAPGSDEIDSSAAETLDKVAEVLRECRDVEMAMEIGGHTDSQGRESMNLSLSQARAEAVLTALSDRRAPVSNLTARGYGEEFPIDDNGTEEGRENNRRIEFKLILPEEPDAEEGEELLAGGGSEQDGSPDGPAAEASEQDGDTDAATADEAEGDSDEQN